MNKQFLLLLSLVGLAILLRLFSFFPSVINHDESTYIVIADAILNGHTYFVDYIDTKPIGIFLLFAGLEWIFGSSIPVLRLITAVWLGLTAFFLYKIHQVLGHHARAGIASGIIYISLSSVFTYYGISPNCEIYFNLFTILSLWLILRSRGGWEYFLAGLLLGSGFLIKYVVVFDGLAFGLFLLVGQFRTERSLAAFVRRSALLSAGFLIPFLIVYLYYIQIGAAQTFIFHTFTVAARYPETQTVLDAAVFLLDFLLRFLPVTLLFLLALLYRHTNRQAYRLGLLWCLCTLIAVLLPGNTFGHYFVQFMLPFSFVAALIFGTPRVKLPPWVRWIFNPKVAYPVMIALLLVNLYFQKKDYYDQLDYPRIVAQYLAGRLEPQDRIYTGNYAQIIYHLLDRHSPIRYVHPSLFWERKHLDALEIPVAEELQKLKNDPPRFILVQERLDDNRLDNFLEKNYRMVKTFRENKIKIFERF